MSSRSPPDFDEQPLPARPAGGYAIRIEDVEYLRYGTEPLLARLYLPQGPGPFPAVVDVHGGAWCHHDRLQNAALDERLAAWGVIVCAVDFRMPPQAGYPASIADIHYAMRWLKSQSAALRIQPDSVGLIGTSSGGHQAMLCAMRPHDARYGAQPLRDSADRFDARASFVVLCWPVIEPLARYRLIKSSYVGGDAVQRELAELVLPAHDRYWGDEATMAEGSPLLALERGERLERPPVFYLQAASDIAHPRASVDAFVSRYRGAGGQVDLEIVDGIPRGEREFLVKRPDSPQARNAMSKVLRFIARESQPARPGGPD